MKNYLFKSLFIILLGLFIFTYISPQTMYAESKKEDKKSGDKTYDKILYVGDSIGEGMKAMLESKIKGIKVDSFHSRTYSGSPVNNHPNGKNALSSYKDDYNKKGNALIVELGTNGGLTKSNISEINSMYDKADIFYVNTYVASKKRTGPNMDSIIKSTNEAISSSGKTVIDWNSKAKPEYIADDKLGVHPNAKGNEILSDLISETIGGGATNSSSDSDSDSSDESSSDSGSSKDDGEYTGNLEFDPFIKGKPVQNNTGIDKKDEQLGNGEAYIVGSFFSHIIHFALIITLIMTAIYITLIALIILGTAYDNPYIDNKYLVKIAGQEFIDDIRTYGVYGMLKPIFFRFIIPIAILLLVTVGMLGQVQAFMFGKFIEIFDILFN